MYGALAACSTKTQPVTTAPFPKERAAGIEAEPRELTHLRQDSLRHKLRLHASVKAALNKAGSVEDSSDSGEEEDERKLHAIAHARVMARVQARKVRRQRLRRARAERAAGGGGGGGEVVKEDRGQQEEEKEETMTMHSNELFRGVAPRGKNDEDENKEAGKEAKIAPGPAQFHEKATDLHAFKSVPAKKSAVSFAGESEEYPAFPYLRKNSTPPPQTSHNLTPAEKRRRRLHYGRKQAVGLQPCARGGTWWRA